MKESVNLKECRGGLRDIESVLLISKAKFHIREHIGENLFDILSEKIPSSRGTIERLKTYFYFIKNLRDLYRLTVAADDEVTEETMKYLVKFSSYRNADPSIAPAALFNKLRISTVETYGIICDLLEDFNIEMT